ncbi:MAG: hypothetical protein K2P94_18115, partial [Rhodospirillaceae bacterium]|nr:hypothetical protein [Rhodospirillaceae bacterium]
MDSNTPQGTGAMTLDQGVAHLKAKLAERGASADDQAIVHRDEDDEDGSVYGGAAEGLEGSALDETAEAGGADELQDPRREPDDRPVTLPDGSEITVDEARKGYLRQADFTRKTTELAQERKALEAREQAVMHELSGLYQHLASSEEAEPDWQRLAREASPADYQRVQNYWRQKTAHANHGKKAVQQAHARAFAAQRQQMWNTLQSGSFEPAWKDATALKTGLENLSGYLIQRGIPAELVSSIHLPAVVEIAEESRRYREL